MAECDEKFNRKRIQCNVYDGLLMLSIGLDEIWDRVWFCVTGLISTAGHCQNR